MKAWTDYPFTWLGDTAGEEAPVREIEVISFDNNKYCRIRVVGYPNEQDEIKAGYIYQRAGRYGEVPCITEKQIRALPVDTSIPAYKRVYRRAGERAKPNE